MKRKSAIKLFAVIVTISLSLLLIINTSQAEGTVDKTSYKAVIVTSGDTLWSIASCNCKSYKDIRKAVYDIKKLNNMSSSSIFPGQKILLP